MDADLFNLSSCLQIDLEEIHQPDPLVKELVCSICANIVCCPLNLETCVHIFCRECLRRWQSVSGQSSCPVCRIDFPSIVINRFLQHRVEQLQVKCPNHLAGCSTLLSLKQHGKERNQHCQDCDFNPFECPHCAYVGLKKQHEEHLLTCPKYSQRCIYCNLFFSQSEFKEHLSQKLNRCVGLTACPNQCVIETECWSQFGIIHGCFVEKSKMNQHLKLCPKQPVICPVCSETFLQSETEMHFRKNLPDEKHIQHYQELWTDEIQEKILDEKLQGQVFQVNDYLFFKDTTTLKWIPVQIIKRQQTFTLQEVVSEKKKSRSFSFLPSKSQDRIMSFDEGVKKFLATTCPWTVGNRVRCKKTGKAGMITAIDHEQVQLNAKEWHHQKDLQLQAPTSSTSTMMPEKFGIRTTEEFWKALTSECNIRQITKRQRTT